VYYTHILISAILRTPDQCAFMIQDSTIKEFHQLLRKEYGRSVSLEEAREILSGTVAYFDLLAKIDYRKHATLENPDVVPKKS